MAKEGPGPFWVTRTRVVKRKRASERARKIEKDGMAGKGLAAEKRSKEEGGRSINMV